MSNLKNIYAKDINREIQGVIKVDDENFIKQELDEYVVTDELLKHFKTFYNAYTKSINKPTEGMGVWISGFFGSGKSHFLKILSYLLENKKVDGKTAIDYFKDKIKDQTLIENMEKSASVDTDVILFNIDSKAGKTTGTDDKLIDIFEKVFNEKMGLSTTPFVAEIERTMIKRGKYEEFVNEFNSISKYGDWKSSRDGLQFVADYFTKAYSKVMETTEEEAREIIDKTERNYSLSIEKFADRLKEYIESKHDDKHVVFLIDEIGQYIGDNSQLMLNLQTIVEDLGVSCGGKAWVIVTSQMAIDDYVKVKGTDFSKIQGRFDTKLSLTSSNVDEVIEKRILAKTYEANNELKIIYDQKESIIRNLLTFSSNTSYQKIYDSSDEFSQVYPFVPYQFKLVQDVFDNIRSHGYAGKHLAHGERSLINAFQKTAQEFENNDIGTLVPFYSFYDTIEEFLESQIQGVIQKAKDAVKGGVLEEIDINVLKMLFMLKNIKEIPSNIDNLTTLYVSNIDDDKLELKKTISESVRRLEAQTLIQRSNDTYIFLTNEEQSINREIKQIHIDENKITEYIRKIVYDYILTDNKIIYSNKPFAISKYIDNTKYTQEYDIGVKVVTNLAFRDMNEIISRSISESNYVFMKLDISTSLYEEIENILQVTEYRRQKSIIYQTEKVEDIIRAKERESQKVEDNIKNVFAEELSSSEIIINGDTQDIKARDPKSRLNEALIILINNVYVKFNYIEHNFDSNDIRNLFHEDSYQLIKDDNTRANKKAYDCMKDYILEKEQFKQIVTINVLLTDFRKPPYGFLDDDILYILTLLLKNDVVSLIFKNELQSLNDENTLNKILRREYYDQTIIKIRQKISKELVDNLRLVAREFNVLDLREDEDGMVQDFKSNCLTRTIDKLNKISGNYRYEDKYKYPGNEVVKNGIDLFTRLLNIRDIKSFFQAVSDSSLDIRELMPKINQILDFFNSSDGIQRKQFDEASKIINIYDANENYMNNTDELVSTSKEIKEILNNPEPYSDIHKLPELKDHLINLLIDMYDKESKPIIDNIKSIKEYIINTTKENGFDETFSKYYVDSCDSAINCLETSQELKDINAQMYRIEKVKEDFDKSLAVEISKRKAKESGITETQEIKAPKVISTERLISHPYSISNEKELDSYIEELKEKLLKELNENKNIIVR